MNWKYSDNTVLNLPSEGLEVTEESKCKKHKSLDPNNDLDLNFLLDDIFKIVKTTEDSSIESFRDLFEYYDEIKLNLPISEYTMLD